jgi:hypothetical protein
MWIALLLFFFQAVGTPNSPSPCKAEAPAPIPSGAPTFIVQAVDPNWQPIIGAQVTVVLEPNPKDDKTAVTDPAGYAKFRLTPEDRRRPCTIKVKSVGFKPGLVKGVPSPDANSISSTAYVQFRLGITAKGSVTVY